MRLCQICLHLDIRKLLLLANKDGYEKYDTVEDKLQDKNITAQSEHFFRHQDSLDAVRDAASGCDLCHAIWHDYVFYRAKPNTNSNAGSSRWASALIAPTDGVLGVGPIYITAAPRNVAAHGKSQVVVFCTGSNSSIQILGWFDVYTEKRTTAQPRVVERY